MNRIYVSGNYIVVETNGLTFQYACSRTVYNYANTQAAYIISEGQGGGEMSILASDIVNWYTEEGDKAYDETTFVSFLRLNTGGNGPGARPFPPLDGDDGTVIIDPPFGDGTAR